MSGVALPLDILVQSEVYVPCHKIAQIIPQIVQQFIPNPMFHHLLFVTQLLWWHFHTDHVFGVFSTPISIRATIWLKKHLRNRFQDQNSGFRVCGGQG